MMNSVLLFVMRVLVAVIPCKDRGGCLRTSQLQYTSRMESIDYGTTIQATILSCLSELKPLKEKPKSITLPFEKPLMDFVKEIVDIQKMVARLHRLDHISGVQV